MEYFGIILSILVVLGVGYYIVKGRSAAGVLFTGGIVLIIGSIFLSKNIFDRTISAKNLNFFSSDYKTVRIKQIKKFDYLTIKDKEEFISEIKSAEKANKVMEIFETAFLKKIAIEKIVQEAEAKENVKLFELDAEKKDEFINNLTKDVTYDLSEYKSQATVKILELKIIDIFNYISMLLKIRVVDIGIIIMLITGFSGYMTKLGANNVIINMVVAPLKKINSPYFLMTMAFIIACFLSLAISSASGLSALLMVTLYPIMIKVGVSRGAAAAVCASPMAILFSPTSVSVTLAAKICDVDLHVFIFKKLMVVSVLTIIIIAITNLFWQKYLDKKQKNNQIQEEEIEETEELVVDVPKFYAILPFTPILGVLLFNGAVFPEVSITTIIIMCIVFIAIIDFIRTFNADKMYKDLVQSYKSMGGAFPIVILIVAAGLFSDGLLAIGFIDSLIESVKSIGGGGLIIMLTFVLIIFVVSIITGSGNAAFFAFGGLVPETVSTTGVSAEFLTIPMMHASNLGRTVSPVAGMIVICAGAAKISPFEIVKRTSVPVFIGTIAMIILTYLTIPN